MDGPVWRLEKLVDVEGYQLHRRRTSSTADTWWLWKASAPATTWRKRSRRSSCSDPGRGTGTAPWPGSWSDRRRPLCHSASSSSLTPLGSATAVENARELCISDSLHFPRPHFHSTLWYDQFFYPASWAWRYWYRFSAYLLPVIRILILFFIE